MHAAPIISSTSARDDTPHAQPPPARLWASVLRLPVSLRPVWRVLVWLLIGWLLASLLLGCSKERNSIANQDEAPAFELELLSGGTIALEELRGQVVALRFWADWCTFCRREMRELEPVYQRLRAQGLEILAVNVGQERGRVERFSVRIPYTYPTLLDPDSTVARRYGVHAIPVTFLIDRQGIVRGRILGESNPATFERMVLPLLNDAA